MVVCWAGKRDRWAIPQGARTVGRAGRGLHLVPCPLEEDDVFLAGIFLVEWCGGQWHGRRGCAPSLEGNALREHVSWAWARGLAGGVWKRGARGVRSLQAPWAAPLPRRLGSPRGDAELWLPSWTGLSERRVREAFSSLPMSLLRSSCCFKSNEAEGGRRVQLGVLGLAPGT